MRAPLRNTNSGKQLTPDGNTEQMEKKTCKWEEGEKQRECGIIYADDTNVLTAIDLPRQIKAILRNYGVVTK